MARLTEKERTLTLIEPIVVEMPTFDADGNLGGTEVVTIDTITAIYPKGRHIKRIYRIETETEDRFEQALGAIGVLFNLTEAQVDELDADDLEAATDLIEKVMPEKKAASGRKSKAPAK